MTTEGAQTIQTQSDQTQDIEGATPGNDQSIEAQSDQTTGIEGATPRAIQTSSSDVIQKQSVQTMSTQGAAVESVQTMSTQGAAVESVQTPLEQEIEPESLQTREVQARVIENFERQREERLEKNKEKDDGLRLNLEGDIVDMTSSRSQSARSISPVMSHCSSSTASESDKSRKEIDVDGDVKSTIEAETGG